MDEFWDFPEEAAAQLVAETLAGVATANVAAHLGKTDSLLHKWREPTAPQFPNLIQFIQIIRYTGNVDGVRLLAEACGFVCLAREGTAPELLRGLAEALANRPKYKRPRGKRVFRLPLFRDQENR